MNRLIRQATCRAAPALCAAESARPDLTDGTCMTEHRRRQTAKTAVSAAAGSGMSSSACRRSPGFNVMAQCLPTHEEQVFGQVKQGQ